MVDRGFGRESRKQVVNSQLLFYLFFFFVCVHASLEGKIRLDAGSEDGEGVFTM